MVGDALPSLLPRGSQREPDAGCYEHSTIEVQGADIAILSEEHGDYISLTDMAKRFGDDILVYNWMRNRNTLELIGIWEQIHNRRL